jgi:hypothetical protein
MRKAFDTVQRNLLWYKLSKAGMRGKFLSALQSLYDQLIIPLVHWSGTRPSSKHLLHIINRRFIAVWFLSTSVGISSKPAALRKRNLLWYKLSKAGMRGKFLSALQSLYDQFTPWFKDNAGFKQGCFIYSSLFAVYINDLAQRINDLQCGIKIARKPFCSSHKMLFSSSHAESLVFKT